MFLLYMVVVFFMVLSMFVTIISEAFAAVCDDASKQSNEYEMIDFMIARFKRWTGLSSVMRKLGKDGFDEDELHNSKVFIMLELDVRSCNMQCAKSQPKHVLYL